MAMNDIEAAKNALIELNKEITEMEQRGVEALTFFNTHLSDQLVFRRANGTIVGKSEFLDNLKSNPFSSRSSKDISVIPLGDRALVTLIDTGRRKSTTHRADCRGKKRSLFRRCKG